MPSNRIRLRLIVLGLMCGCARSAAPPASGALKPSPSPTAAVAAPPRPAAAPTPDAHPNSVEEPSVRPGANAQYRETELKEWLQRFESGGREIFDRRHAIVEASGARPGMEIADVGAGTGLFSLLFARAVAPGGKVYAVDIIPKFLAHLERQAARQHLDNVVTRLGDERSVPLPPNSVDLVFLCDAYHHFEYPRSMNQSLWRALRPGGTLLLIDFKRVPGESPARILEHVRAGQDVFTNELVAAGFEPVEQLPLLRENYVVRFQKPLAPGR